MYQKKTITFSILLLFISAGLLMIQQCKPTESESKTTAEPNGFAGDKACRSCHPGEYDLWSGSGHFKAMLPASDSTVSGNFNNQRLVAGGVSSRFFKKDGKFFINTEGADGSNQDFEIKYTFGYYPLQQYLVEFPGGRMQSTRASWDVKNKKWFYQYAGERIPAHSWLHWTGNAANWNTMCASCHSTHLQKNYNEDSDSYHTTWSSINVSCETCHGAGKQHIDYINGDAYKGGKKIPGSFILLQEKGDQIAEINACAVCHARKADLGPDTLSGSSLLDHYIPEIPTTEHFYADGQANDEDYNYTSFAESKMFRRGVRCSNCHEPHRAALRFTGNELCMQCHTGSYNTAAHTFHTIGSPGSECRNCHMPGKIYMGNDLRYDHTFRVPRPDLSVAYGTPNACNNCHQNKTAGWAAAAVAKWYGPSRRYHFSEDLIPGSRLDEKSESHLIKLLNDTSVPDIVRAASADYLGKIQTGSSLEALLSCLNFSDAHIRYRALESLAAFPPQKWIYPVSGLLNDSVRAVRIAAAGLYLLLPADQIPSEYADAFAKAKTELDRYMLYQADFAVGNVMLGDYYLKQNNFGDAIRYYRRGLVKDSLMNYARLNLSVAYNQIKQNEHAVQVLRDANKLDPKNDRIYFNLALLYNEMNKPEEAARELQTAVHLNSQNPRVYFNYGILLQHEGKNNSAVKIYKKGLQISPMDASLNYALALLLVQSGKSDQAIAPASILRKYYPDVKDYQQLFQYLKL